MSEVMGVNGSPIKLYVDELRVIKAISPVVSFERNEDQDRASTTMTVEAYNGTNSIEIYDGVGIKDISLTESHGQEDTYTITLTDNSTYTFTLVNEANGEAYAIGKRGGEDVSQDDPAYENNALYYALQARKAYLEAEQKASDANAAATQSVQAKQLAEEQANRANAGATEAARQAEAAAQSSQTASAAANSAIESASQANRSAVDAKASEDAAKQSETKATEERTLAETAKADAVNAKTDAIAAKDNAETAQSLAEKAKEDAETILEEVKEQVGPVADLNERLDSIEAHIQKIKDILSSEYSNEETYPVGAYVIKDDVLWISVTEIKTPEEWNEKHWAAVTVGIRLMELQESIDIIMKMEQAKDMSLGLLKRICAAGKAPDYFREQDVIYIPWTDYSGSQPVKYSIPYVIMKFCDVYDEEHVLHNNGMLIMPMYAEPVEMVFDAPEIKVATSNRFLTGYYYYTASDGIFTQKSVSYGTLIPSSPTYYVSNKNAAANIIRFGFARWSQSALRQWMNSDKQNGWWVEQHDCDVAPDAAYTNKPGWMYGFPSEWREFFKPVEIQTGYGNSLDVTYDTFFCPSLEQMYGVPDFQGEGEYWQYWKDETGLSAPTNGSKADPNPARQIPSIANIDGSPVVVALRSGYTNGYSVWSVNPAGYFYLNSAFNARRCLPCTVLY